MGNCNIDHRQADVLTKLDAQIEFLPAELAKEINQFLQTDRPQEMLNELFHLLKKYDLASEQERGIRNEKMRALVAN